MSQPVGEPGPADEPGPEGEPDQTGGAGASGSGRRVLVTGAASGLGAALTAACAARGDRVLATDRAWPEDSTGPDPVADGVQRAVLDITDDADWARVHAWVRAEWGGLDWLVNNAGIAGGGRVDLAGLDEWQRMVEVNLFGMVRGLRELTPLLKEQRSGHVVNIASLAALVHPAGMASYNAVKAAVLALTETVGHELAGYGVQAQAVCPGYFRTGLLSSMEGRDTALAEVMRPLVEESPVSAEEIAAAVLAGVDAGEELIVPDDPARAAYRLKQTDRATYDAMMRDQAATLERQAAAQGPEGA